MNKVVGLVIITCLIVFAIFANNLADNATSIAQAQAQIETAKATQSIAQVAIVNALTVFIIIIALVILFAVLVAIGIMILRNRQPAQQRMPMMGNRQPQMLQPGNNNDNMQTVLMMMMLDKMQNSNQRLPERIEWPE